METDAAKTSATAAAVPVERRKRSLILNLLCAFVAQSNMIDSRASCKESYTNTDPDASIFRGYRRS
jgi:hypothetical protein